MWCMSGLSSAVIQLRMCMHLVHNGPCFNTGLHALSSLPNLISLTDTFHFKKGEVMLTSPDTGGLTRRGYILSEV